MPLPTGVVAQCSRSVLGNHADSAGRGGPGSRVCAGTYQCNFYATRLRRRADWGSVSIGFRSDGRIRGGRALCGGAVRSRRRAARARRGCRRSARTAHDAAFRAAISSACCAARCCRAERRARQSPRLAEAAGLSEADARFPRRRRAQPKVVRGTGDDRGLCAAARRAPRRGHRAGHGRASRSTKNRRAALTEQLRRAVGARVVAGCWGRPALLGGMIVRVGSRMVDASLNSRLQRLRMAMRVSA